MSAYSILKTKKARRAFIREKVGTETVWALRGLSRIYANQTADEQSSATTRNHNGVGFTSVDAEILTSFAQQVEQRGSLTPKQMHILFAKMPKYTNQLERMSN